MEEKNNYQKVVKLVLMLQIITVCLTIYFTAYTLIKSKQYQKDRQEYRTMMLLYQKEMEQYNQRFQQREGEVKKISTTDYTVK
jgi:cytochrome c-type biogenesis protein CcmH/NrfG